MRNASSVRGAVLAALLTSCHNGPTSSESTYYEIDVQLSTSQPLFVVVGQDVVITCTYEVVYPADKVRTWHPTGRLYLFGDWQVISGDTAWSDTLRTFEKKVHRVVLRPTRGVMVGLDADLAAPPEGDFIDSIGGRAALDIPAVNPHS